MSKDGSNEEYMTVEGDGDKEKNSIQQAAETYGALLDNPPKIKFNLAYFSERRKYYIDRRKALDTLIEALKEEKDTYNKKALNPSDFAKLSRLEKLKISLLRFSSDEKKKKIHRLLSRKIKEDKLLKKAEYIAKKKNSEEKKAANDILEILKYLREKGEVVNLKAAARIAYKEHTGDKNKYKKSILRLCIIYIQSSVEKEIDAESSPADKIIAARRTEKKKGEEVEKTPVEKMRDNFAKNFDALGQEFDELKAIFYILINHANTYGYDEAGNHKTGMEFFADEIALVKEKTGQHVLPSIIDDPTAMISDFVIAHGCVVTVAENRDQLAIDAVGHFKNKVPPLGAIFQITADLNLVMTFLYNCINASTEEKLTTWLSALEITINGDPNLGDIPSTSKNFETCLQHYPGSEEEKAQIFELYQNFLNKYEELKKTLPEKFKKEKKEAAGFFPSRPVSSKKGSKPSHGSSSSSFRSTLKPDRN